MSRVIICTKDNHYGQYLRSLVSQAGPVEDFLIDDLESFFQSKSYVPGCMLICADFDDKFSNPDLNQLPNLQVVCITENGKHIPSKPGLTVLNKPLDGSNLIDHIFQWAKKENVAGSDFLPCEPYLIGNNSKIRDIRSKIDKVCNSDVSVLICGQTGTGKGVVAKAIHNNSARKDSPFFALNCATVPHNLLESELFGYKKGAFTGAWRDKPGMFDLAGNGTMFLDEVSEISPLMQAKLLQVLQENEFCPVGGHKNIKVNARTIAATNADLKIAMDEKKFRCDLYYRLAVVRLDLPLLSERKEDIPVLGHFFLDKYSRFYQKESMLNTSQRFWDILQSYSWPGNVRELENTIKKMVVMDSEDVVRDELARKIPLDGLPCPERKWDDLKIDLDHVFTREGSLKDLTEVVAGRAEAELIRSALNALDGKKKAAASALSVSYKSLLKKIKTYGL